MLSRLRGPLKRGMGLLCLLIPACAEPRIEASVPLDTLSPAQIVAGCCDRAGPYPDWMLRLADGQSDTLRRVGLIELRPGRLSRQDEARARLEAALQPLDVLFFHSRNRMSAHLIPGHFTHGAIYLGTEAQLRAAGLWHLPVLAPWRDRIAAGATYLEAVDGGVRLAPAGVVLNTDALVALRPQGPDRAAALARGLSLIGTPFDMRFDATDPSALFCAELIGLVFPAAALPRTPVLDRETIVIDGIVAGALDGSLPFGLVGYVEATTGGGARIQPPRALAWDIRLRWPDRP